MLAFTPIGSKTIVDFPGGAQAELSPAVSFLTARVSALS